MFTVCSIPSRRGWVPRINLASAALGLMAICLAPTIVMAQAAAPASGTPAASGAPAVAAAPDARVQTLNSGAHIHVTVAGAPDVSGDYAIDAAGNIQMLYVNQVHLGGLTTAQAATLLASKDCLGKYYRIPQVVVTLISIGGISAEVTGAVANQGPHVMRPDSTLNEFLQQAGPAVDADLTRVQVTHGLPGAPHTTDTVNYLSFLNNGSLAGNPTLKDGDVIFVPRKEDVQIMVNLRGEVAKPGRASVAAKTTVYDAIQAAGGLLPDADRSGIVLERSSTGDQVPFDYEASTKAPGDPKVNPILMDGDTVVVKAADISNIYTITGAVLKPGEYPLDTKHFTLADAIGKAGGTAERPKLKDLTIFRKEADGHSKVIALDASNLAVQGNTELQPGDIITIPQAGEKRHYDPLQTLGALGGIFSLFHGY